MNDAPLSLLLLPELAIALAIAALAALARAAVGAHRVLAHGVPGSAVLQENSAEARAAAAEHQAAALTAEVMWLGLLSPALLLAAHATQGFISFLGPFTGFALAAAIALLVGSELPLTVGARQPERVAALARPLLRAAAPLRPLASQLGRRRAIAPPPESAAHEAKLIERLFEASSDSGAAEDPVTILMRQLQLDVLVREALLVKNRGGYASKSVPCHPAPVSHPVQREQQRVVAHGLLRINVSWKHQLAAE